MIFAGIFLVFCLLHFVSWIIQMIRWCVKRGFLLEFLRIYENLWFSALLYVEIECFFRFKQKTSID